MSAEEYRRRVAHLALIQARSAALRTKPAQAAGPGVWRLLTSPADSAPR